MVKHASELEEGMEWMLSVLRDFPSDGQLRTDEQRAILPNLLLAGFVERREVTRPCKCCGKEKFEYSYFRITGGGSLFMHAMLRNQGDTNA